MCPRSPCSNQSSVRSPQGERDVERYEGCKNGGRRRRSKKKIALSMKALEPDASERGIDCRGESEREARASASFSEPYF